MSTGPYPRGLHDPEWVAEHDYPRCEHGLSLYADCVPCALELEPASAYGNPGPDAAPRQRCGACNGSGLAIRDDNDVCFECEGSGRRD